MTIYNMPIWLRNTTYNFILESVKAENDANSKFGCLVIDTEQKENYLRYRRNFKQLYLDNLE